MNFLGQRPELSDMLNMFFSLCLMFGGVLCNMSLLMPLGPGALRFVCCIAQFISSVVMGLQSGLCGSRLFKSIVSVGVMRCWCC